MRNLVSQVQVVEDAPIETINNHLTAVKLDVPEQTSQYVSSGLQSPCEFSLKMIPVLVQNQTNSKDKTEDQETENYLTLPDSKAE